MKHLILVRHAKSSWKDVEIEDHARALNKRGLRDSSYMAKVFKGKKINVDLIATSDAVRAFETAKEFAKKLDYRKEKILRVPELYLADAADLLNYMKNLDDDDKVVMIFGHNPGITAFANALSDVRIDNMPTCSIAAFDFATEHWKHIQERSGNIQFFEYPKMYFTDTED